MNSNRNRKKELPQPVMRLLGMIFEKDFKGDQATAYAHYKQLRTRIRILPKSTYEHNMICDYVRNTHGPTHTFKITVEHIFTIARQGEYTSYKPSKKFGNRKLLWHGTKSTNYPSILPNGLLTQPPSNVPITGKMFGNGIYFADVVTKAASYCKVSSNNPYGILILAEVALGKHYYLTNGLTVSELKYNKHSVKGLGRYKPDKTQTIRSKYGAQIPLGTLTPHDDLNSSLEYSEYIIFDNNQVLMDYLVLVKFHF